MAQELSKLRAKEQQMGEEGVSQKIESSAIQNSLSNGRRDKIRVLDIPETDNEDT